MKNIPVKRREEDQCCHDYVVAYIQGLLFYLIIYVIARRVLEHCETSKIEHFAKTFNGI